MHGAVAYLLVGRSGTMSELLRDTAKVTKPECDRLGVDRLLIDYGMFDGSCRDDDWLLKSKYEASFARHYVQMNVCRKGWELMNGSYSVQVSGVLSAFARMVGQGFADRFTQPNPEYGENQPWEALRAYYHGSAVDLEVVRECFEEQVSEDDEGHFEDNFSDFDEAAELLARPGRQLMRPGQTGHGLAKPRFSIPALACNEEEARQKVGASVLNGLSPGQAGVAAQTWQELATVAEQQPDIRWLGRQPHGGWSSKPQEQYWNDYRIIHAGQKTILYFEGHRDRFGEKCMKYGGIDLCVRTLSLWPAGEEVGYEGVLSMFKEIRCMRSFNHYLPRLVFFLDPGNFERWIVPALANERKRYDDEITRQTVANSILSTVASHDVREANVEEGIRICREVLKAEPTSEGGICRWCSEVWKVLFEFSSRGREAFKAFDLMLRHGAPLSESARGDEEAAENILECWDAVGGFGDWPAFRARCEAMSAFDAEGLAVLRSRG